MSRDITVTASHDTTLRLWDVETGEPVGEPLSGHGVEVETVAYSPDGSLIASGAADSVRLWDPATGAPVGVPLPAPEGLSLGVAFDPDGNRLAAGGSDGTLRIFDVGAARTLTGVSVAFGRDGALATGDRNGAVRLWDATTHRALGPPAPGHTGKVLRLMFSPDGQQLVSSGEDGTVRFWDHHTGQPAGPPITVGDASVSALAFGPDGAHVVTGDTDGAVRVWDSKTRQPVTAVLRGADGIVMAVAYNDGNSEVDAIVSTPTGGHLTSWNGESGTQKHDLAVGLSNAGAFGPQLKRLGLGASDGSATFIEVATVTAMPAFVQGHTDAVTAMAFGPQGKRAVTGGYDNDVRLWDAVTGHTVGGALTGPKDWIVDVGFSDDGRSVAAGSFNDEVWVWPAVANEETVCAKLTANMSRKQWDEWVSPDIDYVKACPDLPIRPD